MPEQEIWEITKAQKYVPSSWNEEEDLQDFIMETPAALDSQFLLVGDEIDADSGDIDVLGLDFDGSVVVIELKKGRIDRKSIGQIFEYASWASRQTVDELRDIYIEHNERSLNEAFEDSFGVPLPEHTSESHLCVLGGATLGRSEQTLQYLRQEFDVPIFAFRFGHFEANDSEYAVKSWSPDPKDHPVRYREWDRSLHYFTIKGSERSWSDWREYGIVQAGQGTKYRNYVKKLSVGDLVYVRRSRDGYLGIAQVTDEAVPVTEFEVDDGTLIEEVDYDADELTKNKDDPEKAEYLAGVRWLATRKKGNGINAPFHHPGTHCILDYEKRWRTIRHLHAKFEFDKVMLNTESLRN